MAELYERTLNGIPEKMVILDQNEYMYAPFSFPHNPNWSEVVVGMFWSMTGDKSNNYPLGGAQTILTGLNGSTLIGFKDAFSAANPITTPGTMMIGCSARMFDGGGYGGNSANWYIASGNNASQGTISHQFATTPATYTSSVHLDTEVWQRNTGINTAIFTNAMTSSNYCFDGFRLQVQNRGTQAQTVVFSHFGPYGTATSYSPTADSSALNVLIDVMGPYTEPPLSVAWTSSIGQPLDIPSAFYVRNGFSTASIRIHNFMVKEIS